MNKLVEQSLRILLGRVSIAVLSIIITVYFAYELPKNIFALTVLYSTFSSLIMVITDLGLSTMVIKEGAPLIHNPDTVNLSLKNIVIPCTSIRMGFTIIICILSGIVLFLLYDILRNEYPDLDISFIIILSLCGILFENFNNITIPIFAIKNRFGSDSVLTALAGLLENLFGLLGYLIWNINYYFMGLFFAQFVIFFFRFLYLKDVFKNGQEWLISLNGIKHILISYWPFYVRKFFRFGIIQGEQLIIVLLLPIEQLANFNLAKRFTKYLKVYIEAFSNPLTVRLNTTSDFSKKRKYIRTYLWFTILPCVLSVVLSPWLMKYLGGPKYANQWPIMAILCFSWIFYAISAMQLSVITLYGGHKDILYVDVMGGSIGLLASFLFIITLGEMGLAWGQVVSFVAISILGYKFSQKCLTREK